MRAFVVVVLAGCGRIAFDARTTEDAGVDDMLTTGGFSRVVAYGDNTCAVYEGNPYCWGDNSGGQIGDGTTANRELPARVGVPAGVVDGLTIGETHGCAIIDRKLYCWGPQPPTEVVFTSPVTDVAAGKLFTCAIAGGVATCWGVNDSGQLGDGTFTDRATPSIPISSPPPHVAVDAGDDHACVLNSSEVALCWGHNDFGTLGTGLFTPANSETPVVVSGGIFTLPRIAGWHACTVRPNSKLAYCWGRNSEGALGDGGMVSQANPQQVPNFANVTFVATGGGPADLDATCAISSGELSCWGAGTDGRLGNGTTTPVLVPTRVPNLSGTIVEAALGYAHTCALVADGNLYCWGRGDKGQLGDGMKTSSLTPVRVVPPS